MPYIKRYWCPNGCGKKIKLFISGRNATYFCSKCNNKFTPEEIKAQ